MCPARRVGENLPYPIETDYYFNNFANYDNMSFNPNMVNDAFYQDPMFNPIVQYEQAYMYYRYLSQQMDYKIKCKEYEKMCGRTHKRKKQSKNRIRNVALIL